MNDFSAIDLGQVDGLLELKKRSLNGIGVLARRQVITKLIYLGGEIILARLLLPQIFGIYAIVNFVVQFFSVFGDVGIGAALIQKKGELNKEELSAVFWLQQILVLCITGVVLIAAPLALLLYPSLPPVGVWLIRVLSVSFIFVSLKTIPAILMERKLDFNRIAKVDIIENLVFYITALTLALARFGAWSFIIAALTRAVFGAVMIYSFSAWRPTASFRFTAAKDLLCFGIPYQGNAVMGFIKDAVTPLFVGAYAGVAAVGYLSWAKNLAFAPLILSEAFGRVSFPAFSRIQGDRELLGRTVEGSMRSLTLVMFPVTALMLALGPEIIHVIFTDKWLPGLLAYYFYCTSPLAIGIMLPMYSAILAVGKSGIVLKMMVSLLTLEWGLGVPFVLKFGFNGIAFSQPVIVILFYFVYRRILRAEQVRITLIQNVNRQFFAAIIAGVICKMIALLVQATLLMIGCIFCAGMVIYLGVIYIINKAILEELRGNLLVIIRGDEVKA